MCGINDIVKFDLIELTLLIFLIIKFKDTIAIPDFLEPLLISFFDDSAKKELQTLFNLEFY